MKILILAIVFSFLVACGQQQAKTTAKISVAALTGSVNYPGGILFVARNVETQQRVSRGIVNDQVTEIDIPNGKWNILVVGWDGGTNGKIFEGDALCGFRLGSELTGGSIDMNFQLGAQKCADFYTANGGNQIGAHPIYNVAKKEFIRTAVASCGEIKDYILDNNPGDPVAVVLAVGVDKGCDGSAGPPRGEANAYRFNIMDVDADGKRTISQLRTECRELPKDSRNYTGINVPLTMGNTELRSHFVTYKTMTDCQANLAPIGVHRFSGINNQGISVEDNLNGYIAFDPQDETAGDPNHTANDPVFFVALDGNEGPECSEEMKNKLPFAEWNLDGGTKEYYICSAAQWQNIAVGNGAQCNDNLGADDPNMDCEPEARYILLADIDFGGANTSITGFAGELEGEGYILSNFNQPLFDVISPIGTGSDIYIRDLRIDSANIPSDTGHLGVLAREVQTAQLGKEVEITGVEINNSSITVGAVSNAAGLGGMIGRARHTGTPGNGDNIFIRENLVNVTLTSSSTSGTHAVGGLIGIVEGASGVNTAIAANGVGLLVNPYGYDDSGISFDFDIHKAPSQISVNGNAGIAVGGLIGRSFDSEVRLGNIAVTEISTDTNGGVGGLVGAVTGTSSMFSIENSLANIKVTPLANIQNVGGILGYVNSGGTNSTDIFMKGAHGHIKIGESASPETTYSVNNVGGIIGYYLFDNAALNLRIKDSRGIADLHVDGSSIGGIAGFIDCSGTCTSGEAITRSIAMGVIADSVAGLGNFESGGTINRGGLVGEAESVDTSFNVVDIAVEGTSSIGGFFGSATGSKLTESYGDASLYARTGTVGGFAGVFNETAAGIHNSNSKINFDMFLGVDTGDCTATGCGYLYGNTDMSGYPHTVNVIANFGLTDGATTGFSISNCGIGFALCDAGEIDDVATTDDNTACTTMTGGNVAGGIFNFVDLDGDSTSLCEPTFYTAMYNFAPVFDGGGNIEYYKTGSMFDPYIVNSPAKWNSIGDDLFLMNKAFKIPDTGLDFGNGGFTPIGSSTNPFTGVLFGEGKIQNIVNNSIANTGNGFGLINFMGGGAMVGTRSEALHVENITLTNTAGGTPPSVGIIGLIDTSVGSGGDTVVSVRVNNGDFSVDDGSGVEQSSVGGIIGSIINNGQVDIVDSSFKGKLTAVNGAPVFLGGILGSHSSGSGDVNIDDSIVTLVQVDDAVGGGSIGGVVGHQSSTGTISIDHTAVFVDPANANGAADDIIGASSFFGGLVGQSTDGTWLFFTNSYVSFLGSAFDGSATKGNLVGTAANAPATAPVNTAAVNTIGTGGGNAPTANNLETSYTDLTTGGWSMDDDWVVDSNGIPRQRWEFPDNY